MTAARSGIQYLVRRQTRIALGILTAREELASGRREPANQPGMIVLTDGLANPEPASTAVMRAGAPRGNGMEIFTIGLG